MQTYDTIIIGTGQAASIPDTSASMILTLRRSGRQFEKR
jgi:hypothetical protein